VIDLGAGFFNDLFSFQNHLMLSIWAGREMAENLDMFLWMKCHWMAKLEKKDVSHRSLGSQNGW